MAKLFGTNGVRGVFGEDLTLDFISKITLSIANFFKKGPILVGYDGRKSSVIISKIVTAALSSAGLDSAVCGLVPTPCLQFATRQLGYNGGIMITASHNPPQYNGMKVIARDGIEISREAELQVEEIYFTKKWKISKKFGSIVKESSAVSTYLCGIKKQVNVNKIRSRNLKIVLDLGNGAQAMAAPALCKDLGCETILINEKIDGSFPGRGSEPTPQNLNNLSSMIIKSKADLGIAFDGDGDRSIFCDETGTILTGDRSALLLSQYILKKRPKSKIVTSVNSTSVIEKIAANSESKVLRTRVGSVEVSRKMMKENAIIGFEENGGFMYGKHNQVRDGSMTMAILLDLLASSKNSLSQEMDMLPPSFTTKGKIECSKDDFKKIVKILKTEPYKKDLTDGIKLSLDDSSWIMIRLSGTEPIARLYAESYSQSKLDDIFEKYLQKVNTALDR
ncbi:MAG: phosphoglucosamine mutase [Thaumarchaeota archaeon]|nr:phosphoglucosamine mutase [Nitrososphaerota archaeon]